MENETPQFFDKIEDGQLYWHYTKLHEWEKNHTARTITESNFAKLTDNITLQGILDPLKIGEDGTIYDGNNRYRTIFNLIETGVMQSQNGKDLEWVPVRIEPIHSEVDKWRVALRGNEHFASWDPEGLNNYLPEFEDEIDLSMFNIEFRSPKSIEETLAAMEAESKAVLDEQARSKENNEVNPNVEEKRTATCPNCQTQFEV